MNILDKLRDQFCDALKAVAGDRLSPKELAELVETVRPSQDAKFGDYQANCAMPLAKKLQRPPRDIAADLAKRVSQHSEFGEMCEPPTIAGPGFINLRLKTDWLTQQLAAAANDARLAVDRTAHARKIVIDYSAPNVAKPLHVGPFRSTVIGDALYRTLKFLGHEVISDNHVGDWGTQFGMIIFGLKHPELFPPSQASGPVGNIADYGRLYEQVHRLQENDPDVRQDVLNETAKLHSGDPENLRLWEDIRARSLAEIKVTYDRMGVTFDETLGESFYHDRLGGLVDELVKRGIARKSEGAVGVFLDDDPDAPPFLVQKKDGAFLYATTDLATIQYRIERWHPDAILYVVDHRQSLHFDQLFKTARRWLGLENVELTHISFGTVLGDDGRPFKTRSGGTVSLSGLLDEAVERALAVVTANDEAKPGGPELSNEQRQQIAEVVGVGALKYADLSQNRTSDYVFSYDKMLAMNGNTATYMQYAHARVRSIFAKGQSQAGVTAGTGGETLKLDDPAERTLALELLRFSEAIDAVVADYRPNHLTNYLFALANAYSTFYERCPVLKADTPGQRASRLALCDLTARTLRQGLSLLGIDVVDKM
jgi:arginyl-tRNA synthetase